MSQSQVTDYFHGRKRNGNFQPSKRQKVEVESHNSDVPNSGTLQVARASGAILGGVQTKSTTVTNSNKKKPGTRSRIPKLQTDNKSPNVRLSDIWPKTYDATVYTDLITDAVQVSTQLLPNSATCPSTPKQNLNLLENRKDDASVAEVNTTNIVSGSKLTKSPSKRALQYSQAEERERSTVSDVATAVIDDHGNSHPCTPSKLRTVEPGVLTTNKRGRRVVPADSNNYYKTPEKFDFSPFQTKSSTQRSSSARKRLTLLNDSVTKSPPVFVFKGTPEKARDSSIETKVNEVGERDCADVQNKANNVLVKSSDKVKDNKSSSSSVTEVEQTVETAVPQTQKKEAKTPSKVAADVVKIGTCRNLEQLKKKLQELSPRKAKASVIDNGGSSAVKRYRPI